MLSVFILLLITYPGGVGISFYHLTEVHTMYKLLILWMTQRSSFPTFWACSRLPEGDFVFGNKARPGLRTKYIIEITMTIRFIPSRLGNHEYSRA